MIFTLPGLHCKNVALRKGGVDRNMLRCAELNLCVDVALRKEGL